MLLPLPIHTVHRMAARLADIHKTGTVAYLYPDGKTQVTIDHEDGQQARVCPVSVSTQHNDGIDLTR